MPRFPADSRRLAIMAAFGFLSGLPLPLTIFTLQQWFATYGVSLRAIGFTAWVGLPYTLKFLWSGLFDRAPPPSLALGRRRFWLFLIQPALAGACLLLASGNPAQARGLTLAAAALLAFLSASQDIVIDAWRIETFPEARQGLALALYVWGYRAAMLVSGAGVIFLSSRLGWHGALGLVALLLALGIAVTLLAPEPAAPPRLAPASTAPSWAEGLRQAVLLPLGEFLFRPGAGRVLAMILLFRIGKVFADTQAAPFYRYRLHFTSDQVAAANAFELAGALAGAAFGGVLVARLGAKRALLGAGLFLSAALGLYPVLLAAGHSQLMLTIKVLVELFAEGTVNICFLAYLSLLCAARYTATQYALLSSVSAVALHVFSGFSGFAVEALGYPLFFACVMLAGLPALALLWSLPSPSACPGNGPAPPPAPRHPAEPAQPAPAGPAA